MYCDCLGRKITGRLSACVSVSLSVCVCLSLSVFAIMPKVQSQFQLNLSQKVPYINM